MLAPEEKSELSYNGHSEALLAMNRPQTVPKKIFSIEN
jgi:hypothetical protein